MRTSDDVYWNTSLPKDHEALQELDSYCKEWGGLTRAEATRRLLIEWARLRRGKEISAWGPNASATVALSASSEGSKRTGGGPAKTLLAKPVARAASQVLDD